MWIVRRTLAAPGRTVASVAIIALLAVASAACKDRGPKARSTPRAVGAKARTRPGPTSRPVVALTARDAQRYLSLLKDGTPTALEQALRLWPLGAEALVRLARALQKTDPRRAREAAAGAARFAVHKDLRIRCYNLLGELAQEQGDKQAAVAAYRRSYAMRSEHELWQKIVELSGKPPVRAGGIDPGGLSGPFSSLESFCSALSVEEFGAHFRCIPGCSGLGAEAIAVRSGGALRGAAVLATGHRDSVFCSLMIETRDGWYADLNVATCAACPQSKLPSDTTDLRALAKRGSGIIGKGRYDRTRDQVEARLDRLSFRARAKGQPAVLLFGRTTRALRTGPYDEERNEVTLSRDSSLVICGVGPSKRPSCTRALKLVTSERSEVLGDADEPPGSLPEIPPTRSSRSYRFLPTGDLQLRGPKRDEVLRLSFE